MTDTDYKGDDKLLHFVVCFLATLINTYLAVGLALGKEYGDSRAPGNHWCWWDLAYGGLGILVGTLVKLLVWYLVLTIL